MCSIGSQRKRTLHLCSRSVHSTKAGARTGVRGFCREILYCREMRETVEGDRVDPDPSIKSNTGEGIEMTVGLFISLPRIAETLNSPFVDGQLD